MEITCDKIIKRQWDLELLNKFKFIWIRRGFVDNLIYIICLSSGYILWIICKPLKNNSQESQIINFYVHPWGFAFNWNELNPTQFIHLKVLTILFLIIYNHFYFFKFCFFFINFKRSIKIQRILYLMTYIKQTKRI